MEKARAVIAQLSARLARLEKTAAEQAEVLGPKMEPCGRFAAEHWPVKFQRRMDVKCPAPGILSHSVAPAYEQWLKRREGR
jgi:hypothetical protein